MEECGLGLLEARRARLALMNSSLGVGIDQPSCSRASDWFPSGTSSYLITGLLQNPPSSVIGEARLFCKTSVIPR